MPKPNDTPDNDVRRQYSLVDLLRYNWASSSNDAAGFPMPDRTPLSVNMLMATIETALALAEGEDEDEDDVDFNGQPATSTRDRKGSGTDQGPAQ